MVLIMECIVVDKFEFKESIFVGVGMGGGDFDY